MVGRSLLGRLRSFITNRMLGDCGRDSIYNLVAPLATVFSLCAIFYVERKPNSTRFRLNFLLRRHIPGWILLVITYYQLFNTCSIYSFTCAFPIFLNAAFFPVCLLTERHLRDLFNALENIDSCLRSLGVTRVINDRRQWIKLSAVMVVHLMWILFIIQYADSFNHKQWMIRLSITFMAIQRRFNFIWFQFLCDQLRERFRLIESVWTVEDHRTMEQVRLVYQRARETVQILSRAFGPRLLFMMIDLTIQCTRFFIFTFIFHMERHILFFILYFSYHYYCIHVTTTASDNLAINVELLWFQIDSSPLEVSICGLFSYNRGLLLSLMNSMVAVWVLLLQTAPAVVDILNTLHEGGVQS